MLLATNVASYTYLHLSGVLLSSLELTCFTCCFLIDLPVTVSSFFLSHYTLICCRCIIHLFLVDVKHCANWCCPRKFLTTQMT